MQYIVSFEQYITEMFTVLPNSNYTYNQWDFNQLIDDIIELFPLVNDAEWEYRYDIGGKIEILVNYKKRKIPLLLTIDRNFADNRYNDYYVEKKDYKYFNIEVINVDDKIFDDDIIGVISAVSSALIDFLMQIHKAAKNQKYGIGELIFEWMVDTSKKENQLHSVYTEITKRILSGFKSPSVRIKDIRQEGHTHFELYIPLSRLK